MLASSFDPFRFLDAGRQYVEEVLAGDSSKPSAKDIPPVNSINGILNYGEQSPHGLFGLRHALSPCSSTAHRLPDDNERPH